MAFDEQVLDVNIYSENGGTVITLRDNVAIPIFRTPALALGDVYMGNGTYAIKVVTAANEIQAKYGFFNWAAINATTGGIAWNIVETDIQDAINSTGTNTMSFAGTSNSGGVLFAVTSDTTLVPVTFTITIRVNVITGPGQIIYG